MQEVELPFTALQQYSPLQLLLGTLLLITAIIGGAFAPFMNRKKTGFAPWYLYTRDGCHLCDEAQAMLENTYPDLRLVIQDVESRQEWFEAYDTRVPVLQAPNRETLDWPFDHDQLLQFVRDRVR